jgi:hypothetical protein
MLLSYMTLWHNKHLLLLFIIRTSPACVLTSLCEIEETPIHTYTSKFPKAYMLRVILSTVIEHTLRKTIILCACPKRSVSRKEAKFPSVSAYGGQPDQLDAKMGPSL